MGFNRSFYAPSALLVERGRVGGVVSLRFKEVGVLTAPRDL